MLKKAISVLIILVMLVSLIPRTAYALDEEAILMKQTNDFVSSLNNLYSLRAELVLDYDTNKECIEKIDQQLTAMGVEQISFSEIQQKLGQASSCANVSSTSYTRWDSVRTIVPYQGKFFEVQIITGVRNGENTSSGLWATAAYVDVGRSSLTTGAVSVFKVVLDGAVTSLTDSVASGCPYISAALATGKTFFDAYKACSDTMKSSDVLYNVQCTYFLAMDANERYVFVKYMDTADSSQILGYAGNRVACTISVDYATGKVDSEGFPITWTYKIKDTFQSAYYEYPHTQAAQLYYAYDVLNTPSSQLKNIYILSHMKINCLVNSNGSAASSFIVRLPYEGIKVS